MTHIHKEPRETPYNIWALRRWGLHLYHDGILPRGTLW